MPKTTKKFYLTTSIPYVNAPPHLGFTLELVQADAVARAHRLLGEDVFFLTGADENSLKNVRAAEAARQSTKAFIDGVTGKFIELAKTFGISHDGFLRTSTPAHHAGAQKLWSACKSADIYRRHYEGLYCVGCETFYTTKDLVDGKCPEHLTVPEAVSEDNYFFRLSKYAGKLEKLITSGKLEITPQTRRNEVLSFIQMGLEDFSISRSLTRAKGWGVPVPGDSLQVMYVWFDALANYLTGLGYDRESERFSRYWPADVHVIGKGVSRFHAIYWPAMLLSAGLPLPKRIFIHGYLTIDGNKISKSLGNTVDPFDLAKRYGVDPVRYYLLRYVHPVEDSDFTEAKFREVYTADLANGLGNLVSRVTGLLEQNKFTPKLADPKPLPKAVRQALAEYSFDAALKALWEEVRALDVYVSETQPWQLAKEGKVKKLATVLQHSAEGVRNLAHWLQPFLPQTAEIIRTAITAQPVVKAVPMFPRLE